MEKIFKGFKQVTSTQFNEAKDKNELAGYLWFVRTEVKGEGEETNDVGNDSYDIYFGSKQYGHFSAGEIEGIKASIESLNGEILRIDEALELLTEATEANASGIKANAEAISGNAKSISEIEEELKGFLIKNVDSNDKVLSVADGIIASQIGLKYEDNFIILTGKDNTEISKFDASAFVKDSVLENVEVITKDEDGEKYIQFTWKTEGDTTKTDEIKVSDFAKLYEAGTALEISEDGVTFNVKVAANDNFISVNQNNELIVDDITTDKAMLKEAITIEGGPLATDAVKNAFSNGVIPAGTDIQSVLKALLCVEIYPTPTDNKDDITYSVSIENPSVTASGVSNNALVEVGQTIKINAVSAKAVSISKTNPKVETFEHGYSASIDGEINTGKTISGTWTISQMGGNVYELSAAATGFTGTLPTTVQNADASGCTLSACDLVAIEGTNTYTVTEDAPKHTGSYTGVESMYVVSNLGGRSEEHKSPSIEGEENIEKDPTNKSGSFTVVGVYPIYTNGVSASTNDATAAAMAPLGEPVSGDGTKLSLMKAGTAFAVSFANQSQEAYKLFLPGTWKVSSAKALHPTTNKYEVDCKANFVKNGTVTRTIQGKEVTYTVYNWASTEGPNRVKFTVA